MASFPSIHAGQGGRGKGSQVLAAVTRSPGEMVVRDVTGPGRARAGHVIGSSCATAEDFAAAIRLIATSRVAIAHVFSHHFPLARAAKAFEFAMSRPPDAIKIVVTVN
jgi:threonine dehydrogenase-like Zn-dependent dehydrogenase